MKVSCHQALFATVNKFEVINFALNEVPVIMEMLGLTKEQWAIGGSIAGMLYGIDFGRCPHDVDIIVPVGLMKVIHDRVDINEVKKMTKADYVPSGCTAASASVRSTSATSSCASTSPIGRVTIKDTPLPLTLSSTLTAPPCRWTSRETRLRPIPVPT